MKQTKQKVLLISENTNNNGQTKTILHPDEISKNVSITYKYPGHFIYIDKLSSKKKLNQVIEVLDEIGRDFHVDFRNFTNSLSPHTKNGFILFSSKHSKTHTVKLKRLYDLFLSMMAAIALSPVLLMTAILIKASSKGPVLYKQKRIGLHGREFTMYKFRSMVVNADKLQKELTHLNKRSGPTFKIDKDPRITPIGHIIRKHSIDELPQLINIITGDMSIVGPRPPLKQEFDTYATWQKRRLSITPGLTCYWQILKNKNIDFSHWVNLDLQYIDNWSIWQDFLIITKTIPEVIFGRSSN